jgi:homoserine kinase
MRRSATLMEKLRARGLPAVISGAGPTVLTLARDQVEIDAVTALVPETWVTRVAQIADGAHLV